MLWSGDGEARDANNEDGGPHDPKFNFFGEEYSRIAQKLNRPPRLEDLLIGCDLIRLFAVGRELGINGGMAILLKMKLALASEQFSGPVTTSFFASKIPEIAFLVKMYEGAWRLRWPGQIFRELSTA